MAKNNQQSAEQKIVVGIFRGIWWLISLPFRGIKKTKKLSLEDQKYLIAKKNEIGEMLKSENQLELRHAVMEADKLVDWNLRARNYRGQTFADRLRLAKQKMPREVYNSIWAGHKVRNRIAHEDGEISAGELKSAVYNLLKGI
ncbi:MAG: hypothetical protein NTW79_00355 [Candidatus Berkelbacteria bacterium]|nr:hypothetical protein [Candidatus Berkelbacteria bacterium]